MPTTPVDIYSAAVLGLRLRMFYNAVCYSPGSRGKESNILLLNRREGVKDWIGGRPFDSIAIYLFVVCPDRLRRRNGRGNCRKRPWRSCTSTPFRATWRCCSRTSSDGSPTPANCPTSRFTFRFSTASLTTWTTNGLRFPWSRSPARRRTPWPSRSLPSSIIRFLASARSAIYSAPVCPILPNWNTSSST